MRALVVYESMFGSTRALAEQIGAGLAEGGAEASVVEVGALLTESPPVSGAGKPSVRLPQDVDLLIVGGPTHALSMSRATTRADAAQDGPVVSSHTGIREWIEMLVLPVDGVAVATFGTKVQVKGLPGSAADAAAKRLRKRGGRLVAPSRNFAVRGRSDGLVDGELEAAHRWGTQLAGALTPA